MPVFTTGYPPINNRNYYSGTTISRPCNLWYESFQSSDHMKAEIVRRSDGAVLSSKDMTSSPWSDMQSSATPYTGLTITWTVPNVTEQTPVNINRTFYFGSKKLSTVSFEGNVFPKFKAANLPGLSGKKVALFDLSGSTKTVFDNIGLTYTSVSALSGVTAASYDVLVIGAGNPTSGLSADFARNGGRVLCLSQALKPALPITLPALVSGAQKDVQFLFNGGKHKVFEGLDQRDLSYWAGDVPIAQNVYDRPTATENIRVLCAANNDGDYAPILEVPAGKGTYILSQMELVSQYNNEPAAGKLLVNMLNYLGKPRDVMTLAHELGHGVHQVLAAGQGTLMSQTPLTLAETASVFGEMLTFRHMLESTSDLSERRAMLAQKVEDMINTVVRQIAFYLFERKVHTERLEGELTQERLGELWMEVQKTSLGEAFRFDDSYRIWWSYIPHFIHSPFYVYAYAFGDCLVNSLYAVYRQADQGFQERYFELLKAGGTKHHGELLAPFGLDATEPSFWNKGLSMIEGLIDELEALDRQIEEALA